MPAVLARGGTALPGAVLHPDDAPDPSDIFLKPVVLMVSIGRAASPSRYLANSSGRPRRAAMATRSGSQDNASSSTSSPGSASRRDRNAAGLIPSAAAQRSTAAAAACAYRTA